MHKAAIALVLLVTALLVSGCATTTKVKSKTVEPEPAVIQKKVHAGDLVHIGTKDGKYFDLRVTQVTSEAVIGKNSPDAGDGSAWAARVPAKGWRPRSTQGEEGEIIIPFSQMDSIEIRKIVTRKRIKGGGGGGGDVFLGLGKLLVPLLILLLVAN